MTAARVRGEKFSMAYYTYLVCSALMFEDSVPLEGPMKSDIRDRLRREALAQPNVFPTLSWAAASLLFARVHIHLQTKHTFRYSARQRLPDNELLRVLLFFTRPKRRKQKRSAYSSRGSTAKASGPRQSLLVVKYGRTQHSGLSTK